MKKTAFKAVPAFQESVNHNARLAMLMAKSNQGHKLKPPDHNHGVVQPSVDLPTHKLRLGAMAYSNVVGSDGTALLLQGVDTS